MAIRLNVNGVERSVEATADTPLLWVLREDLRLTGTKFSCGRGFCGACTVHLDGQPVRSCSLPVGAAEGKNVTTIEGLSSDASHPVQTAWIAENVPQCGYCQSGQIMSAAALLADNPRPSERIRDSRGTTHRRATSPGSVLKGSPRRTSSSGYAIAGR